MSESIYENITYEVDNGRARITLNRPEKRNALSIELVEELRDALWDADNNNDVHCVILKGAGPSSPAPFSSASTIDPPEPDD